MSCWKAIGSPSTVPSPNLLTAFDGHSHKPHGIIPAFPICVGGKVVNIEIEVIDANLDYNHLLGRNWVYEMDAIISTLFRVICFPHEGKIVKEVESRFSKLVTSDVCKISNPLAPAHSRAKGNMSVISETISINISRDPNVIENLFIRIECSPKEVQIYTDLFKEFRDVFAWSYEEILGIDPSIVQHEIKTYENAKPVRQRLRPVNPRKVEAIKAEIEKLLKAGFIYPVPLTD
eukprot:PITA_34330